MKKKEYHIASFFTFGVLIALFYSFTTDVWAQTTEQAERNSGLAIHILEREGLISGIVAVIALIFSAYSLYESSWRKAAIRAYAPSVIHYTDPSGRVFDVFGIPITLTNHGAKAGTVVAMDLHVFNSKTQQTKKYYCGSFGKWKDAFSGADNPFAPISVKGKEAVSQSLLFYPRPDETISRHIDTEGGLYEFRLSLHVVSGAGVRKSSTKPLTFKMQIGPVDYRRFDNGGSIPMFHPDLQPSTNA